jgi:hypothetical protein
MLAASWRVGSNLNGTAISVICNAVAAENLTLQHSASVSSTTPGNSGAGVFNTPLEQVYVFLPEEHLCGTGTTWQSSLLLKALNKHKLCCKLTPRKFSSGYGSGL